MDAPVSNTCELRILGLRATVAGPRCLVTRAAALFPGSGAPTSIPFRTAAFEVVARDCDAYEVTQDGSIVEKAVRWAALLPALEWAINKAAIAASADTYFLFHAGALAYAGRGFLLPAPSGSGKTTLTTALLGAGFGYLSDDIAALDPQTARLVPFPKLPCLKEHADETVASLSRGLPMLAALRPVTEERVRYLQVPPCEWGGPVPLAYVILPRFEAGAATRLVDIPKSRALVRLVEQTFTMAPRRPDGVARMIDLLRSTACFELTYGDVREAVHALRLIVDRPAEEGNRAAG